jgi:hypothetical protein
VKFARPLKAMLEALYQEVGIPAALAREYTEGSLKESIVPGLGETSRSLMETLGTKWGREIVDPFFWVKATESKVKALMDSYVDVVIDDMRFLNEYEMVKRLGGKVVRIERPGRTPKEISEGHLEDVPFDVNILNDGTLQELHDKAAQL